MNFFVKTLLKRKLKGMVPDDQIDMFITMVEKNPAFFEQIAKEIQDKISQGMDQQTAATKVMESHKAELAGLMGK
jgi:hypothetical protein